MKLQIVNPLEIADWDDRIHVSPGSVFFHSRSWASVIFDTWRFPPFYLVHSTQDRLQALIPFMETGVPWNKRGVSLPFTDFSDPFVCSDLKPGELLQTIITLGKSRNWNTIDMRGSNLFESPSSSDIFRHTLALDSDQLMKSRMDKSTIRCIRKSGDSGVTVDFGNSCGRLDIFYRLYCLTRRRHGLPPQPLRWFRNIKRHIIDRELGTIGLARYRGLPVAGAVYFYSREQAIYKYGASDMDYQHVRPNNLLMWEAMRYFAGRGFSMLNLGKTETFHTGLLRFKEGLGGVRETARDFRYNIRKGDFIAYKPPLQGIHNQFFRKMPISVSCAIGALIYRYVS